VDDLFLKFSDAEKAVRVPVTPGLVVKGEGWFESAAIVEVDDGIATLWVYRNYLRGPQATNASDSYDDAREQFVDCWPVLADRGTFLLCCDEAERRGVDALRFIEPDHAQNCTWGWGAARCVTEWETETARVRLIQALARALRDSA
jgi:hypothetical protein